MEAQAALSLSENAVIFVLSLGKPGDRKKVKRSSVQVNAMVDSKELKDPPNGHIHTEEGEPAAINPDQDLLTVHKDIINSPELEAIRSYHGQIRKWVGNIALPCETLKGGMYMITLGAITKVEAKMKEFAAGLVPLLDAFHEMYPERVAESFARLGALADPMDYPETDDIMREFKFEYNYLTFSTPTSVLRRLGIELAKDAERKLTDHFQGAAEQIEQALALSFQQLVNRLMNSLRPTDGKTRKVTSRGVDSFNEFFEVFTNKNVLGQGQLADLITRAHNLINGATPEEMNQSQDIKTLIANEMAEIQGAIDSFVTSRTGRRQITLPVDIAPEEGAHGTATITD